MSGPRRMKPGTSATALAALAASSLLLAGCAPSGGAGAGGADFPTRPVELVNPWAAGGSHDAHARAIGSEIQGILGKPMTVSIKSGGAGSVGASDVAKRAKPDGYTLLLGDQTSVIARPMVEELPYTWEDLRPVAQINDSPIVLVVPGDSPYDSVEDFVTAAEDDPGALSYGSVTGLGPDQIPVELFIQAAGIDLNHVPFDGGGTSYRALLAKDVDMAPLFPAAVTKDIEEGRLKALAVTSPERHKGLPDVPTLTEEGYEVEWAMFRTVFAPKDTPDEVVEVLEQNFTELAENKEFVTIIEGLGEEVELLTGPELQERIATDAAALDTLVKELG
ncbi:tripartite tricarboxylate transporter substrate binding protein [Nocardiopsis ansamitocini]|uniref:Tat pathway signal protein n=1 Tax=Nocardiopsis ansamitocini TaxID=1670832 RepID=A0A9W6UKB6_9ACTN|nr:tripartite tricarboxylate transporter substrate binding protein [Nocardiopsis ansamitocini]GLU49774.1 Tat pathway signal protein [Nocardiopsis ansamitocini]